MNPLWAPTGGNYIDSLTVDSQAFIAGFFDILWDRRTSISCRATVHL